jgi:glycosyltransferase involved in cell wall biosynthesis
VGWAVSFAILEPEPASDQELMRTLVDHEVNVVNLVAEGATRIAYVRAIRDLVRWVRRRDLDVLHVAMSNSTATAALLDQFVSMPPLVLSRRSMVSDRSDTRLKRTIRVRSLRRAAVIVANSEAVARDSSREEGVTLSRYRVIYNALDDASFIPSEAAKTSLAHPRVVAVGNLRPGKGHDTLLAALAILKSRGQDVAAILVGEGPLRSAVESEASSRGLSVFLPGSVSDVRPFLAAADVYVQASRSEGMSNALLEALAYGMPVVATDVGGTREVMSSSGLLVEPDCPQELADAISSLLQDRQLADAVATAAKSSAERFRLAQAVEGHTHIYCSVAGGAEGGQRTMRRGRPRKQESRWDLEIS